MTSDDRAAINEWHRFVRLLCSQPVSFLRLEWYYSQLEPVIDRTADHLVLETDRARLVSVKARMAERVVRPLSDDETDHIIEFLCSLGKGLLQRYPDDGNDQ